MQKKNIFSSLKMQFVLILMGAILPFFLLSIYNINHLTKLETRNAELNAQEQAYIAAREFETSIQNARHVFISITRDQRILEDRDYCQNYTEAIPYRETSITNIIVLNTDGSLFCSSTPQKIPENILNAAWYAKVVYGQSQYIVPIDSNWDKKALYTTVTSAHFNKVGATDGIIIALINQEWIKSVRSRINLPGNSTISLFTPSGTVLYRDPFVDKYIGQSLNKRVFDAITNDSRKGSYVATGLDGMERFYGYNRLDPIYGGDYVQVGIPKNKALESVQNLLVQNILITLLVVILAIAFTSSFAGTRILKKVEKLVDTSKKLADGDLNIRTGIDHNSGELGFLAHVFDSTIEALKQRNEERQNVMDDVLMERQFFETLVASSPDAIAIRDETNTISGINPAFTGLFGYTTEDLKKNDYDELINTPETLEQGKSLSKSVREGGSIHVIAKRRTKSGRMIDVEINAVPIVVNGIQVGDLAIYHDITELIEAKRNAEASAQAKADFLANMSHEIRTPLNAVIGMTNLLMDTNLDGTQSDFVNTIRTSGEDLLTIINDILDFSKIEAGKLDMESMPFDLGDCVESALQLMAPRVSEKGLELLYLIDPNTPSALTGDPTRLRQILVNLLGNAIKFTEKGEIFLSVDAKPVEDDQYEVHFAVKDTGIGISEMARGRMFKSFSQADTSTTRKFGGTGLGLSISKRLAENMGGTMWYESEPGKGSTFHFTILSKATEALRRQIVTDSLTISKGKTILVVDDNDRNRQILQHQLQSWEMNCISAGSGFQALEILKRITTIDAAIVDMQMPEMDGVMLARSIREIGAYKKLPLILLSSLGRLERGDERGSFAAQLSKPVRPSILLETLLSLFTNRPVVVKENQHLGGEIDPQMGTKHPLRILLADDNVVNQKVATRMLERLGYRADLAANGLEVLQAVERQTYDLVFMDVQMPEMDGMEASRQIHKRIPAERVPRIVAMTAHALQGDRERFLAEGMDDYLSKPVQFKDMIRALQGSVPLEAEKQVKKAKPEVEMKRIDWNVLNAYYEVMGDDTDAFLIELVQTFLPNAQKLIDDLRETLANKDLTAFHRGAHTLKSSSASLGAMQLSEMAKKLEAESNSEFPADSVEQVAALQNELDLIIPDYKKFLQQKTEG
jgi:PAS domain S-box-containing protein